MFVALFEQKCNQLKPLGIKYKYHFQMVLLISIVYNFELLIPIKPKGAQWSMGDFQSRNNFFEFFVIFIELRAL